MTKYDYSRENLAKIVSQSESISDVARALGMTTKGANHNTLKRKINEFDLDTSHFKGKGWSKGRSLEKVPIEDYLNNTRKISSWKLKNRLLEEHLKENVCEICGISEWNGKPISCQLHHKDGDNTNNSLDNLQMLCPNCHSQTDNFAGRKNRKHSARRRKHISNIDRALTKEERSKINQHPRLGLRRVARPSYLQFKKELTEFNNNYCAMARKYGISDSAIRKWEKSYKKYGV